MSDAQASASEPAPRQITFTQSDQRVEPPTPWILTDARWAFPARLAILVGSNAFLLAGSWLIAPPH